MDFVKISDPGVAPAFRVHKLPSLIYFRRGSHLHYHGDLKDEDAVLRWVVTTKEEDEGIIEEVDGKELEKMLDNKVTVVVYFCKFSSLPHNLCLFLENLARFN